MSRLRITFFFSKKTKNYTLGNLLIAECEVVLYGFRFQGVYFTRFRPRLLRGRVFAWGTEGCRIDPQPRHTKSRLKMVQAAPLITLGIER